MINACAVREDDEDYENKVDILFNRLEKKNANHFAVREYKRFKLAAGVINCGGTLKHISPTAA